jgi:hypothetical protein
MGYYIFSLIESQAIFVLTLITGGRIAFLKAQPHNLNFEVCQIRGYALAHGVMFAALRNWKSKALSRKAVMSLFEDYGCKWQSDNRMTV